MSGFILTSDATGNASWQAAAISGWSLTGNAGTSTGNFIGTTDAKNLVFKTNSAESLRITSSGSIIGL